jgi:hypothetical protein
MPLVLAKANLVSRISITMDIRIITKCGMILYSSFSDKNALLGNIYIPPENTKYSCLDAFNEIESEMFQLSEHSDPIGLLGDINAKTGKLLDYVETDKSLLTIFYLQDDVDLINYMHDYKNIVKAGASLSRNSNCTGRPNTYGHMLLDFCRKNNIYIVNGRVGVSRISITMDIRIITKCGMILYSSFWGYVKSSIYVQFVFHNVGTSIMITEFLHGWDQYSPSFANFLRVLLINFEWFMY